MDKILEILRKLADGVRGPQVHELIDDAFRAFEATKGAAKNDQAGPDKQTETETPTDGKRAATAAKKEKS